ncbi:hypothetical protein ACRALDRAFT_1095164 [Sodiomyces alcalophilus JCM 7366]|uniref:uncharacterized protein n=1 Tax=Sodiomyces alcalophilus JCM 7366 TaxID=591952 RepID=UPI0039B48A0E
MTTQIAPRPGGQSHGRLDKTLGITERIAPKMKAWTGELRVRYTDFQVNEITRDGTVLHLKDTRLADQPNQPLDSLQNGDSYQPSPPESKDTASPAGESKSEANGQAADQQKEEPPEVSPEDIQILTDLTSESFTQDVLAIYRAAATRQPIPVPARSAAIEDKDQRAKIHQNVRRIFRSLIDTTADTSDVAPGGAAAIIATGRAPRPSKGHNQQQNRARNNKARRGKGAGKVHAEGEGDHLHFTIYKENRDTMDAVRQLARCLFLKPQNFVFAGTKDRRAATTQRCSVRGVKADTVAGAYTRLHSVWTGDYRYEPTGLHLGALQGNEFVITLKNCRLGGGDDNLSPKDREDAIRACATSALASMASRGWIHYYGHQRFGTHAIGTHEVGQRILNSDYEGAVSAILAYDDQTAQRACDQDLPAEAHVRDELNRARACRAFQRDGASADEALRFLPRRFAAEAAVIRHLGRHTRGAAPGASRRDFQGALLCIPRPLRNLYLHAYQSLVWNHAASRRWAAHGDRVVAGDLVLDDSNPAAAAPPETKDPVQTNNEAEPVAGDDDDLASEADADGPSTARALTAEEAASGRYTIHDIVLPSPGHNVIYPANDIGDFYAEFMGRPENGGLDPRSMLRRHREFSLPGHYRHLTTRFLPSADGAGGEALPLPRVEVRRYADDEEQMHPTDLDRVRAARKAQADEAAAARKRKREDEQDQVGGKDGEGGLKPGTQVEVDREAKKAKVDGQPPAGGQVVQVDQGGDGINKKGETPASSSSNVKTESPGDLAKDKVAVIVHFRLGKSAYATVALRELMGFPDDDAGEAKAQLTSSTGGDEKTSEE